MMSTDELSRTFAALADPTRRDILARLAHGEATVSELAEPFDISFAAVSKHLRVLRDAGFVEARVEGQRRVYHIRPEPLREVDAWLAPFRQFWTEHVDALERHLDRMEKATTESRTRGTHQRGKPK
jgi:DNA-binding transcriptional ArsR family regulator